MSDAIGCWEVAARVASGEPRIAFAVVGSEVDAVELARELAADLAELSGAEAQTLDAGSAREVENAISSGVQAVIIADALSTSDWGALDRARSRLLPRASVILVVHEEAARRMSGAAPSLASWLTGSVYIVDTFGAAGDAVREERLAGLRQRYKMTDAEAISKAEQGDVPSDPEFAVWLVLLGRDDLVRRGAP